MVTGFKASKNNRKKISLQSGQASRILIILAVVVFVVIIAVYGVIKLNGLRLPGGGQPKEPVSQGPPPPPEPVYEKTLGDTRFLFVSAEDLGDTLPGAGRIKDMVTTEKYIRVAVAAQNKGKTALASGNWSIGNIIDAEGRSFAPVTPKVPNIIPKTSKCGAALKPEFEPITCVKLYEVSRVSNKLTIQVIADKPKKATGYLDLEIK